MNTHTGTAISIIFALLFSTVTSAVWATDSASDETPKVNINEATEVELAYLPGVGPTTAENIAKYRAKKPFQKVQHLMRVKGIGRKTFEKMRPFICVKGQTTATRKLRKME